MPKLFLVPCARRYFERHLKLRRPAVAIAITDPPRPLSRPPATPWLRAVLRLQFDDVGAVGPLSWDPREPVRFTPALAEQAWSFLWQHLPEVDVVVCHCEAGRSRSRGLLAGLADALGQSAPHLWLRGEPNPHVRALMAQASSSQRWPSS